MFLIGGEYKRIKERKNRDYESTYIYIYIYMACMGGRQRVISSPVAETEEIIVLIALAVYFY